MKKKIETKNLPLNKIKGITSLEELVQYDQLFRNYTNKIVIDKSIVDDLVQDMYIKLHNSFLKGKVIDGGYIVVTLKNLYLNHCKLVNRNDRGDAIYEAHIPELEDDIEATIEIKEHREELFNEMENRLEQMTWYEKGILHLNEKMSLLELSRQSKISYRSLIYSKNKINDKLGITKK